MSKQDFEDIIVFEIYNELLEKGLEFRLLSKLELVEIKFLKALELLERMSP